MNPAHEELRELLAPYALGALEETDRRRVEAHLDVCESCERELLRSTEQLELLAETVPPIEPSEATRVRLLRSAATADAGAPEPPRRRSWPWRAVLAASLVLLAWSGWRLIGLGNQVARLEAERSAVEQRFAQASAELNATRAELRRLRLASRIIVSPGQRSVVLAGLDPAPGASGQTFVDPESRRAVFYATNLPAATADSTYQLWFIADGAPVSGGTFEVDEDGNAMVIVEKTAAVDDIELWTVTLEPAGGVPQPTGPMVLRG